MRLGLRASLGFLIASLALSTLARGTEVILLLDATESMEQSDPDQRRAAAASAYVHLLGDESSLGVVEFNESPQVIAPLLPLDSENNRISTLESVESLSAEGAQSDLQGVLTRALEMFDLTETRRRALVLVSDGSSENESGAFHDLVSQCQLHRIVIHTVALGPDANASVLRELSAYTGGEGRSVDSAEQLCEAMLDILTLIEGTQLIPVEEGVSMVDATVNRAVFVLTDETSAVSDPEGNLHRADDQGLVAIDNPVSGDWSITPPDGALHVAALSDLRLEVNLSEEQVIAGQPFSVQASLSDRSLAPEVDMEMRVNGEVIDDPSAVTLDAGLHNLKITARGMDLAREQNLVVAVSPVSFRIDLDPENPQPGDSVVVEALLSGDDFDVPRIVQAHLTLSDGTARMIDLLPTDANHFAAMEVLPQGVRLVSAVGSVFISHEQGAEWVHLSSSATVGYREASDLQAQLPPLSLMTPAVNASAEQVESTPVSPEKTQAVAAGAFPTGEVPAEMPPWMVYLIASLVATASAGAALFFALRGGRPSFPSLADLATEAVAEKTEEPKEKSAPTETQESAEAPEPEAEPEPEKTPEPESEVAEGPELTPVPDPEAVPEPEPEPEVQEEVAEDTSTDEEEKSAEPVEEPAEEPVKAEAPVKETSTDETEEPAAQEPDEDDSVEVVKEDLILTPDEVESIFGGALGDETISEGEKSQINFGDEDLVLTHDELNDLFEQATADPIAPTKPPENE